VKSWILAFLHDRDLCPPAFKASIDKIFFFLAAGFPDQKIPVNFFYRFEFLIVIQ
jgi:hypothetical protein